MESIYKILSTKTSPDDQKVDKNEQNDKSEDSWIYSPNLCDKDHKDFITNVKGNSDETIDDDDDLWAEPEFHKSETEKEKPKLAKGKFIQIQRDDGTDEGVTTISLDELMEKYPALKNVKELQDRSKNQEVFSVHKIKDMNEDLAAANSGQELPMDEIKKILGKCVSSCWSSA